MKAIEVNPAKTPRGMAYVVVRTPRDGLKTIGWRSQTHRCCGQVWKRWNAMVAKDAPVCGHETAHDGLMGEVSQCGTCGSTKELRFHVIPIHPRS